MKHLSTLCALLLSCTMLAQGPVEFPWNPDSDGDDFIGVSDLTNFLAVFGQDFTLGTFITSDSTHMLVNMGVADYTRCLGLCSFGGGQARVATRKDLGIHSDELNIEMSGNSIWVSSIYGDPADGGPNFVSTNKDDNYFISFSTNADRNTPQTDDDPRLCFCAVEEFRKKEYLVWHSSQTDGTVSAINESINAIAQDGWIWLGQIEASKSLFWRWAE